jgi:hypothetical protein
MFGTGDSDSPGDKIIIYLIFPRAFDSERNVMRTTIEARKVYLPSSRTVRYYTISCVFDTSIWRQVVRQRIVSLLR